LNRQAHHENQNQLTAEAQREAIQNPGNPIEPPREPTPKWNHRGRERSENPKLKRPAAGIKIKQWPFVSLPISVVQFCIGALGGLDGSIRFSTFILILSASLR
jgi:hypothetical protein